MTTGLVLLALAMAMVVGCAGDGDEPASARSEPPAPPPTDASKPSAPEPVTTPPTTEPPPPTPETPTVERLVQLDLVDPARPTIAAGGHPGAPDRSLQTAVHLPADSRPAPLIVLAHGAGGAPEKFTELASAWSDAGYVVAAPRFPLSNNAVPEPYLGDVVEQSLDISFLIDEVLALNEGGEGPLSGRIEPGRVGLYGLSLGSLTVWTTLFGSCCGEPGISAVIQSDGTIPFPIERLAEVTFPVLIAHSDVDHIFPYDQAPRSVRRAARIRVPADAPRRVARHRRRGHRHAGRPRLPAGDDRVLGPPPGRPNRRALPRVGGRSDHVRALSGGLAESWRVGLSERSVLDMARTTLRAKGQLTLPDEIRKAARLEEGDLLEAEVTAEGILLRPQKLIDATQAWFWTPDWQAGEREADADRSAGRLETFQSDEEFLATLSRRTKRQSWRAPD